jgi:hypothetical protein
VIYLNLNPANFYIYSRDIYFILKKLIPVILFGLIAILVLSPGYLLTFFLHAAKAAFITIPIAFPLGILYAGRDQSVHPGMNVILGVNNSIIEEKNLFDDVEYSLDFSWSQIDGPTVTLSNPTVRQPTFIAPQVEDDTTLMFRVYVEECARFSPFLPSEEDIEYKPHLHFIVHTSCNEGLFKSTDIVNVNITR